MELNESCTNESASDSSKDFPQHQLVSFCDFWTLCIKMHNQTLTMSTHFPKRCLVVMEYMVFSVKPHYSALVVSMQTAISKGEMAPDKLITSHVFFRKNSLGLLCPPQLGLTKGHLVNVQDLLENDSNHREEQGQCFSKTKSLMTYFTVGLMFCPDLFCVLLGVPLIL